MMFLKLTVITSLVIFSEGTDYTNTSHTQPSHVRYYPKDTIFKKGDLIDRGCAVFLRDCPQVYRQNMVCARHYDGQFKTFDNYCDMEYENCNSWRKWSLFAHRRC